MAKKKLGDDDVRRELGAAPQAGRKPTAPKTVDGRLEQLVKESEAWFRLFKEVWFNPESPLIEQAVGASEQSELDELYDAAIDTMRWVAASAEYAQGRLAEGKAKANMKREKAAKQSSAGSRRSKTRG